MALFILKILITASLTVVGIFQVYLSNMSKRMLHVGNWVETFIFLVSGVLLLCMMWL